LDSAAVAAAITASFWEDRLLGQSETLYLPVRCAWVATGNNPALSDEITRRAIRIRIDAKRDQPWLRPPTEFRHPHLREWAIAHRSELVWAALTLGRAWIAAGHPRGTSTLGMFENWAAVMDGILQAAYIPGFLANLADFYRHANADRALWLTFLAAWWERFRDREVGVSDLFVVAAALDPPLDLGEGSERSQKTTLGKLLSPLRDRQFQFAASEASPQHPQSVRLVAGGRAHRAQGWRLLPVDPPAGGERGEHFSAGGGEEAKFHTQKEGKKPAGGEHGEHDEPGSPPSGHDNQNTTQEPEKGCGEKNPGERTGGMTSPTFSRSPEAPEGPAADQPAWEEL
jgi:putative DNA primase/helicase